jgi:hypothetical protein
LGAILLVSRCDMQSQQMAQRVYGRMDLRSLAPFGPVISGARARLRRRSPRERWRRVSYSCVTSIAFTSA